MRRTISIAGLETGNPSSLKTYSVKIFFLFFFSANPGPSSHFVLSLQVDQRGFDFPYFFLSLSGKTKKQEFPAGGRIKCKAPTN